MFLFNKRLIKLLIILGFSAECNRTEIIHRFERSVMLKFIHDVMSPVTQFGKNGFLAQIGKGAKLKSSSSKSMCVTLEAMANF